MTTPVEFLFGRPDQFQQLSTKTGSQQAGLSQILSQMGQSSSPTGSFGRAENYLSSILKGGPEGFEQFSQPYLQQFEQRILPRLTSQFQSLGGGMGGGIGSSSGFGQALGGAASDFSNQLAQLFTGLQQNAAGQASANYGNLANLGLGTNTFENVYQPGNTGLIGTLVSALAQGAGTAGGIASLPKILKLLGMS